MCGGARGRRARCQAPGEHSNLLYMNNNGQRTTFFSTLEEDSLATTTLKKRKTKSVVLVCTHLSPSPTIHSVLSTGEQSSPPPSNSDGALARAEREHVECSHAITKA